MRISLLTFMLLFYFVKANSQNPAYADTTTYTFIVTPDEEQGILPCGTCAFKTTFRYQVLESDYKTPLYKLLMVHYCHGDLVQNKIYKITARAYTEKKDGYLFINRNIEQLCKFEFISVNECPLDKYEKLISKIHQ